MLRLVCCFVPFKVKTFSTSSKMPPVYQKSHSLFRYRDRSLKWSLLTLYHSKTNFCFFLFKRSGRSVFLFQSQLHCYYVNLLRTFRKRNVIQSLRQSTHIQNARTAACNIYNSNRLCFPKWTQALILRTRRAEYHCGVLQIFGCGNSVTLHFVLNIYFGMHVSVHFEKFQKQLLIGGAFVHLRSSWNQ